MDLSRFSPEELAVDLLHRSTCAVQVAAVIADKRGIFAWGVNNAGQGFGQHAEAHAISRANRSRFAAAAIFVAAIRPRRSGGVLVTARPCLACQRILKSLGSIYYRSKEGLWMSL